MGQPQTTGHGARWKLWALPVAALAWVTGCTRAPDGTPAPAVEPAAPPSPPIAEPSSPPVAPPPPGDTTRDRLLVTETEYQGWKYYSVYCERCHAPDAVGTADAPDLRYSVSPEGGVTADSFRVMVRNGSENREMKGFEDLLDDRRIEQLYAYVKARSDGRLAAGRPHRPAGPR